MALYDGSEQKVKQLVESNVNDTFWKIKITIYIYIYIQFGISQSRN